ncbi:hypothetical protein IFVP5_C2220042 [Vibrio parahaemolyticus]
MAAYLYLLIQPTNTAEPDTSELLEIKAEYHMDFGYIMYGYSDA